jgi:hypothetical protein
MKAQALKHGGAGIFYPPCAVFSCVRRLQRAQCLISGGGKRQDNRIIVFKVYTYLIF